MTGHHQIPSKIKLRLFTSRFNRGNHKAKFDYWDGRKILLFLSLYSLMSGYIDYRVFSKQTPWSYWPKKLFILTSWGKEGCWSTSSNQLFNYLTITYWEISQQASIIFHYRKKLTQKSAQHCFRISFIIQTDS